MFRRFLAVMTVVMVLSACAPAPAAPAPAAAIKLTLAMSYVPNVQFAHFYTAVAKGYYAAEGLEITFDYKFETESVQRVAQGSAQFGLASGDSVLLARAQGLPLVTVATNSQRFPIVFFSKAAQNITTPEDLKGKSIGIPGRFGASYIGLQALLYATKIQESELNIQEVGFAQVAALSEDKVQVASGYGNNEPIRLAAAGVPVNSIRVSDFYPLVSDGIVTAEKLIAEQPELARAFVRATLRGMQDVIADPAAAFTTTLEFVPELKTADAATQAVEQQVLRATVDYWQSNLTNANGLGFTDAASWQATHVFLRDSGLLTSDVDVSKAFTNEFLK
ncbi:MAG: ABC transporter substrate-binding protein [Roseiflexaceae bacterium]|nr:ABC transporter substrate-binding protein [Roseiflexaceae bacterium]